MCFTDFNHKQVSILARGATTVRGTQLAIDLEDSISADPRFQDQKFATCCKFSFNHPEDMATTGPIDFDSDFFSKCGASIQQRIEFLMNYRETGTDFQLKPCMTLKFGFENIVRLNPECSEKVLDYKEFI